MLTTLALMTAINCYQAPTCPGDLYMACIFVEDGVAEIYLAEVEPMTPEGDGKVRKGVTPSEPTDIVRFPGADKAFTLPDNCYLLRGFQI